MHPSLKSQTIPTTPRFCLPTGVEPGNVALTAFKVSTEHSMAADPQLIPHSVGASGWPRMSIVRPNSHEFEVVAVWRLVKNALDIAGGR